MARCEMHVIHDGKVIGLGLWDGTVDIVSWPRWVTTREELSALWNKDPEKWPDDCGCEPVRATLWIQYGRGLWWEAPVCLEHRCILGNRAHESKEYFTQKEHEKNPPEVPERIGYGFSDWLREQNPSVFEFICTGYPPKVDTTLAGWDPTKGRT